MKPKLLVAAALCTLTGVASACWIDIPLQNIVKASPTVVVGTIDRIVPAENTSANPTTPYGDFDTAYIKVDRVLKNGTTDIVVDAGKEVPLLMPAIARKNGTTTDITYPKGTTGVWILERKEKSAKFFATYPKDLQPLKEEPNVVAIIAKQKTG